MKTTTRRPRKKGSNPKTQKKIPAFIHKPEPQQQKFQPKSLQKVIPIPTYPTQHQQSSMLDLKTQKIPDQNMNIDSHAPTNNSTNTNIKLQTYFGTKPKTKILFFLKPPNPNTKSLGTTTTNTLPPTNQI